MNPKKEIKHYEDEQFEEKTVKYLNYVMDSSPYFDPDGTYTTKDSPFYQDMTAFLNHQQSAYTYQYHHQQGKCHGWIEATHKKTKQILYLRTDQFGFSFFGRSAFSERYPYGHYFHMIFKDKTKKEREQDLKFIAKCVNDSRTIGGSFLWPVVLDGNKYSSHYNRKRGIASYIEDRVDLTLWEIQKYYEGEKNLIITEESIDKEEMKTWLDSFETFSNYVQILCFDAFVHDEKIIDIVNSNIEKKEIHFLTDEMVEKIKAEYKENKNLNTIKNIQKKEDLKRVLNNVRILIRKRSKQIEGIK